MSAPSIEGAGGLFQIGEPERPRPSGRAPGRGIGIDLGTTYSLVAVAPGGSAPRVLADARGRVLLPSVVAYDRDPPEVGWEARARQAEAPARVIASVKRMMGRAPSELGFSHPYRLVDRGDGVVRIDVGGDRVVTPIEVSARILEALRLRAEAELGGPVGGAVVTVPAYFDETQRQATKDAARIAGLEVYRLLAEPTAAAVAYGLDRDAKGLYAVYDLGGGTFDVSILSLREGVFRVLATGGDSALGGDDFDRALAAHLLGAPTDDPRRLTEALMIARAAKERLSVEERVPIASDRLDLSTRELGRSELERLLSPIARRTAAPCRRALADAGVDPSELDGVVLVGGSTRMPLVRGLVRELFGRDPLSDLDPDCVVAYGAAIQADVLSGSARPGLTLLDVVPLSLGIETMGGVVEKLIPRNATIPISARQTFTNYSERQTGMVIHVVQGERELAADDRSLARFELRGIPALPPSMARVEVTFQLDADALLTVTARELMTGVQQTVEVKPTHGLPPEEIDRMVEASLVHASEDFEARDRAEGRVELGRVLSAVERALADAGDDEVVLPPDERTLVLDAVTEARLALAGEPGPEELREVRELLERLSEPFARRRMERALQGGMRGRSIGEIEAALEPKHEGR